MKKPKRLKKRNPAPHTLMRSCRESTARRSQPPTDEQRDRRVSLLCCVGCPRLSLLELNLPPPSLPPVPCQMLLERARLATWCRVVHARCSMYCIRVKPWPARFPLLASLTRVMVLLCQVWLGWRRMGNSQLVRFATMSSAVTFAKALYCA
jgi:hypothetical protein